MLYICICIPWCTHACAESVHELECTTLCSAGLSFRVYNIGDEDGSWNDSRIRPTEGVNRGLS